MARREAAFDAAVSREDFDIHYSYNLGNGTFRTLLVIAIEEWRAHDIDTPYVTKLVRKKVLAA